MTHANVWVLGKNMCEQFFGYLQRNPTVLVTVNLGRPHKGSKTKMPADWVSGHRLATGWPMSARLGSEAHLRRRSGLVFV